MPTTSTGGYNLPLPTATDPDNVPGDLANLAAALDKILTSGALGPAGARLSIDSNGNVTIGHGLTAQTLAVGAAGAHLYSDSSGQLGFGPAGHEAYVDPTGALHAATGVYDSGTRVFSPSNPDPGIGAINRVLGAAKVWPGSGNGGQSANYTLGTLTTPSYVANGDLLFVDIEWDGNTNTNVWVGEVDLTVTALNGGALSTVLNANRRWDERFSADSIISRHQRWVFQVDAGKRYQFVVNYGNGNNNGPQPFGNIRATAILMNGMAD